MTGHPVTQVTEWGLAPGYDVPGAKAQSDQPGMCGPLCGLRAAHVVRFSRGYIIPLGSAHGPPVRRSDAGPR